VPLILSRAFAPALARGDGAIVNITSIAGHMVHPFAGSAYATSKAALSVLTREMAADFAKIGVRVNAVAPGEIETAMLSPESAVLLPRIPLHRLGVPSDVAGTVFFLCSDDAAYVTGTEISVNGGQHIF
jgi:NAD(P)-dependent dehydrogenase (short-subunit alcohol dehydrogenase family)